MKQGALGTEVPSANKQVSLSIVKASQILKLVGDSETGSTLTEIAKATKFGTTVCHRMLATLERERLLDKDAASGRYRLGIGILTLAHKVLSRHPIAPHTVELIDQALRRTEDTVLLMVREGDEVVCIDRKEGAFPVKASGSQIGTRLPMHCGGGPLAILAFSSDDYIDQYLRTQPLEKRTARTVTDPNAIKARIAQIRKRGYAVGDQDLFEYVVAIGVPIFASGGALLGALSVGGVKLRYDEKHIREVGEWLAAAAHTSSASLK